MATLLRLGPADAGRAVTFDELMKADCQEGYRYELIDGRLVVSPQANLPAGMIERWMLLRLHLYTLSRPDVLNCVLPKARVFVPGRADVTAPEPDVAAYRDFPLQADLNTLDWRDFSPALVVEVVSEDDPDKDLVRNVELYRQVRSIREYWIVDPRQDANRPTLTVYRRAGRWRPREFQPGDTYTTPLLPGFSLVIDPRR